MRKSSTDTCVNWGPPQRAYDVSRPCIGFLLSPECPYEGVAVALRTTHRHILISVIHDTLGGRVSL